jgi:hypothetical protein
MPITIRLPASKQMEVPASVWSLAHKRVAHLERLAFRMPIADLLANAYLQGINDTIQTFDGNAT